jgi:hypothetical protein
MNNPLLSFDGLPQFDQIGPEHVAPAIAQLLTDANAALETVTAPDFAPSWSGIAVVLDVATERLSRAWGSVSHLNSVLDTPELRAAQHKVAQRVFERLALFGVEAREVDGAVLGVKLLVGAQASVELGDLGQGRVVGGAQFGGVDHAVEVADAAPGA